MRADRKVTFKKSDLPAKLSLGGSESSAYTAIKKHLLSMMQPKL
jgi:hypothetical protein